jgi:hypothetical protein
MWLSLRRFLTLCGSRSLPFGVALRVWDCFLLEGEVFLFRTAVALLYIFERALLRACSLEDCLPILRHMADDLTEAVLFEAIRKIIVPPYIKQFLRKIEQGELSWSSVCLLLTRALL